MKRGISPIIAIVLLIAIAVIAAVGMYFWLGGVATQQPTMGKPITITVNPVGDNKTLVINTGNVAMDTSGLTTSDPNVTITCPSSIGAGEQALCNLSGATSEEGFTIYGNNISQVYVTSVGMFGLSGLAGVPAPVWWDTSFSRRKVVTLTVASGSTSVEYQMRLNVTYDSDMETDFEDVKFVDNDDSTDLSYWLENKTDSEWAVIWVKVDDVITAGGTDIYMYYGNPSTSSASNGVQTFEFFDDFEGQTVGDQPSGWSISNTDKGDFNVSSTAVQGSRGAHYHDDAATGSPTVGRDTDVSFVGKILEYWINVTSVWNSVYVYYGNDPSVNDGGNLWCGHLDGGEMSYYDGSSQTLIYDGYMSNTWYFIRVRFIDTTHYDEYVYSSGKILLGSVTNVDTDGSLGSIDTFQFGKSGGYTPKGYVDGIRLRQYANPEPTASYGDEETQ